LIAAAALLAGAMALGGCRTKEPVASDMSPATSRRLDRGTQHDASYYLELAELHERHQEPGAAMRALVHAIDRATTTAHLARTYAALARLEEADGHRTRATQLLAQALDAVDRGEDRNDTALEAPAPPDANPYLRDEIVHRLGRLYQEEGSYGRAESLYRSALPRASSPYARDQLLRQQVALYREMGTLREEMARRAATLDNARPNEMALRFLAIAHESEPATGFASTPGAPASGASQARSIETIRVYELLRDLHPNDSEMRRKLVWLYEAAGRPDDAVALLRGAPDATPSGTDDPAADVCVDSSLPILPPSPAIETAEEIVRVYRRAGNSEAARAETAKLLGRPGAGGGLRASLAATRLYAEQGLFGHAHRALDRGAKAARTAAERRAVVLTEADLLLAQSNTAELERLYGQWTTSRDPCLRAEAVRRLGMMSHLAPTPSDT
jgi:tetratricopeptide (TPR) repeat protein